MQTAEGTVIVMLEAIPLETGRIANLARYRHIFKPVLF